MGSSSHNLDKRVPGAGRWLDGELPTLRQFVCYLLGYLSFIGLATLLGITIAILFHLAVGALLPAKTVLI